MTPVIYMTPAAEAYVTEILAKNPGKHLRVSVNNKGCAGHKYQYDLRDWDDIQKLDETVNWANGRLVIDGRSMMLLLGSTLDLHQTDFEQQLVWDNPMASSTCGCGASFSSTTGGH